MGIEEVRIDGERIFLRRTIFFDLIDLGWSVVNPSNKILIKNGLEPISEKQSRLNSLIGGNWFKFMFTIILILLILGSIWEFHTILKIANECIQNSQSMQIRLS